MSEHRIFDCADPAATRALGLRLGQRLFASAVVGLVGPLGAGKTFLVRAMAEGLGIADARLVSSPTYVLVHEYPARLPIYHFDAYRLAEPREFLDLGPHEYFEGQGVCLVEWADRVADILPSGHLWLRIEVTAESARRVHLNAFGVAHKSLLESL